MRSMRSMRSMRVDVTLIVHLRVDRDIQNSLHPVDRNAGLCAWTRHKGAGIRNLDT